MLSNRSVILFVLFQFRRLTINQQCTILLFHPTASPPIQLSLKHTHRCMACKIIPIRLHRHSISNPWQHHLTRQTVIHPPLLLRFTVKTIFCLYSICKIDSDNERLCQISFWSSPPTHPFAVYVQIFFSCPKEDNEHVQIVSFYIYTIELCAIGTILILIYLELFSKNANKFLLIVLFSSVIFDLFLYPCVGLFFFAFLR